MLEKGYCGLFFEEPKMSEISSELRISGIISFLDFYHDLF